MDRIMCLAAIFGSAYGIKLGYDYFKNSIINSTQQILQNQSKTLNQQKSVQAIDMIITQNSTVTQALSSVKIANSIDVIRQQINQSGYNFFERLWNESKASPTAILSEEIPDQQKLSQLSLLEIGMGVGSVFLLYFCYQKYKRGLQQTHNSQQLEKIHKLTEKHTQLLKRQINEDITKFQQKKNQLLTELIQLISEVDYIKHKNSKQKIVVIGQISAGKSSILNLLLNVQLQVGVGETTSKLELIGNKYKYNADVYDAPGVNKQFDIFSTKVLKDLFKMDTFIVCYQNCLSDVNHIIRVLSAISKNTKQKIYLVRTQCDRFKDSDALTIDKQLQVDREYLKKMNDTYKNFNYDYQIFATSARESLSYRDNKKLQKILKNLS